MNMQLAIRRVGKNAGRALQYGLIFVGLSLFPNLALGQDQPDNCALEPYTIAQMQWPSAAILAHVHAHIIREEFGCTVDVVPGDLSATSSSMASTGRPLVAPELWLGRIPDIWNSAVKAERVRPGGASFSGGALESWFVPKFVAGAAPEMKGFADIATNLAAFTQTDGKKPRFISCPSEWACAVINRNLLRAHGLDGLFEIIEPANRFEMDQLIGDAMSRKMPVLFYYWQPNGILAQFEFMALDAGAFVPEAMACLGQRSCATPEPSAFVPEPVVIGLSEDMFQQAPRITGYFQRAVTPLATINAVLAWQNEQSASVEETADHFLEAYPAVWRAWLGK